MTLLDRYLISQFTKNLVLVMSTLLVIYLLVDFFERVDNFLEAQKTVGAAVQYLLLKIPLMCEQLMPVAILLAGVITLGLLNQHYEFMALKAGGLSVSRIIRPLIMAAVVFTILTIAMGQWILPATVAATNKIWYEEVKREIPQGIVREGRTYYRGVSGMFSFVRIDPHSFNFTDFSFIARDEQGHLQSFLRAATASWHDGVWYFENGQVKTRNLAGNFDIILFESLSRHYPEKPADFFIPEHQTFELTLVELFNAALSQQSSWFEFHKRLSYMFLGLPLMLIGIAVLLTVHKTGGRDLALAIPLSCGMAFVAWGLWSGSQAMVRTDYLPPALASWAIHLLAGGTALFLIKRHDR